MLNTRRARLTILLALAVAIAVPTAVLAAPKGGYYIDPKLQVYVVVGGSPAHIKSFQGPCLVKPQGGGPATQQGGYILKKKLSISKKGKFSYNGKVKLQSGDSTTPVPVKIAGRFKHGKAKGTVTFTGGGTACEKTTFSGKYYGKHPQG